MKHIYLIGDIHGDWRHIRNWVQRMPKLFRDKDAGDENILICLGLYNFLLHTLIILVPNT